MNTKTLGCTLLIAGTTIGAGMLALPLASSSLGGPATLLLLIGLWALMAFTAMLQVEASLNTGKWYLHQLADHLLGPWGKRIASFCWLITSCRSANNIMPITFFLPAFIASSFYSA
ncbi:hypothetical protein WP2S18C03_22370 [Aeromonas veronii]|nr:hypothetical protein WP2S18C03_22370 [Aeromonas veronii]